MDDTTTRPLRSTSVLRAVREDIELRTEDGLTLVGELAVPEGCPPKATLVTLHPLPTAGGFMDSHVLRKAAWRLPELADLAVLRFNTRGTESPRGRSEGSFGEGVTERYDLAAAMQFVRERNLPDPWLVGWSFGTEIALMHGRAHPIRGAILLSPPLHRATDDDLSTWATGQPELHALIPEHDDFLRPEEAEKRFRAAPAAQLIPVAEAKHLWVGERQVSRVLTEIVRIVGTAPVPLPTEVGAERFEDDA